MVLGLLLVLRRVRFGNLTGQRGVSARPGDYELILGLEVLDRNCTLRLSLALHHIAGRVDSLYAGHAASVGRDILPGERAFPCREIGSRCLVFALEEPEPVVLIPLLSIHDWEELAGAKRVVAIVSAG